MTEHPILHCLIYGEPGAGKTTFASTWPTPMLVLFFDPYAKETAFLGKGKVQTKGEDDMPLLTPTGAPLSRVWNGDQLLYQVEYYHEGGWQVDSTGDQIPVPQAYEKMVQRLVTIDQEIASGYWKTIVLDSLTYLEIAIKTRSRYKINIGPKFDARHHGGAARMTVEQLIMNRFAGLNCNVVLTAHEKVYEDDISKDVVRCPHVVGTMGRLIGAPFSEMYRIINDPQKGRSLQTRKDYLWPANSTYAPNPCEPNYAALWGQK